MEEVTAKLKYKLVTESQKVVEHQQLVGGLEHNSSFIHMLGISPSQLTNSRGVGIPPTRQRSDDG